ncbi:hypothetical protein GCM10010911_44060 [Paenibacillus nasutitermitis]|uniref:Uncharacterized protein n=1 Tax=Paenibacillus nasutitermitis TaxID=1652958 RepID=A0A916Z9D2_9BACL|nr:hypothetical protein GCM10010911_44060 [Paenibacillus nasutitermitis]
MNPNESDFTRTENRLIKEKYLTDGIGEYAKRLELDVRFEVLEMPDEKAPETKLSRS